MSPLPAFLAPTRRLIAAAFLVDLYVAMVSLAVQNLGVYKLGAPNYALGLLGTMSAVAYTVGCLFSGSLSDRFGRRRCAVAGCLGSGIAWALIPSAETWQQVLCITPFAGAALSLYWPSVQAWLAELTFGGRKELNRNLGLFNVLWCMGLMVGPVVCGYVWLVDPVLTCYLPAALIVCLGGALLSVPRGRSTETRSDIGPDERAPHEDGNLFLKLAWFGNFASWFCIGTVLTMFPKLGHELRFSVPAVGWVLFAGRAGQVLLFIYTSYEQRWQYKLWPLLIAQGAACAGMLLAVVALREPTFALGFALSGACAGITYVASLFYALHGRTQGKGRTSGFHEAVLGSGGFLGPLLGGFAAQGFGVRAPFLLAAMVMAAASVGQVFLWRRGTRSAGSEAGSGQ